MIAIVNELFPYFCFLTILVFFSIYISDIYFLLCVCGGQCKTWYKSVPRAFTCHMLILKTVQRTSSFFWYFSHSNWHCVRFLAVSSCRSWMRSLSKDFNLLWWRNSVTLLSVLSCSSRYLKEAEGLWVQRKQSQWVI